MITIISNIIVLYIYVYIYMYSRIPYKHQRTGASEHYAQISIAVSSIQSFVRIFEDRPMGRADLCTFCGLVSTSH